MGVCLPAGRQGSMGVWEYGSMGMKFEIKFYISLSHSYKIIAKQLFIIPRFYIVKNRFSRLFTNYEFTAIIEISTFTFFGNPRTATVSRAGNSPLKYFPYTSFTEVNSAISVRKIVVFTTFLKS